MTLLEPQAVGSAQVQTEVGASAARVIQKWESLTDPGYTRRVPNPYRKLKTFDIESISGPGKSCLVPWTDL